MFRDDGTEISQPLLQPLFSDLIQCEQLLAKDNSQFAKRTYIRCNFAFIEAVIYWLKHSVSRRLAADLSNGKTINISKLELLGDYSYRITDTGEIRQEPLRASFINYCAFVVRSAYEIANLDPNKVFSDHGWRDMRDSLKVRHRLTHPKKPDEMEVSDQEIENVRSAHRWLLNTLGAFADNLDKKA